MRVIPVLLMGTALISASGCKPAGQSQTNGADNSVSVPAQPASCSIDNSHNWLAEAHEDAAGKKVAIVTGKVDVKSAGYTVTLVEGTLDAGPPPVQHVTLNVVEPTTQNTQVITTLDVTVTVPIAGMNEKVAVDCAGKEIARTDVVRP